MQFYEGRMTGSEVEAGWHILWGANDKLPRRERSDLTWASVVKGVQWPATALP
jgi:hypothetical protein